MTQASGGIYVLPQHLSAYQSAWSSIASKIFAMDTSNNNDYVFQGEFVESDINEVPAGKRDAIEIFDGAFESCQNLSIVSLPNCIRINSSAFINCDNITEFSLPQCLSLSFGLPSLTKKLYAPKLKYTDDIFSLCYSNLESVTIDLPIYSMALDFRSCKKLTYLSLPWESLSAINYGMFNGCELLSFPDSLPEVSQIGSYAFFKCYNLRQLSLPKVVDI